MTIHGLIFDYGGVLWDMRWDVSRALEHAHGLRERAIADTLYGSPAWERIRVGVGDHDAWRIDAHQALEAIAGKTLPPVHEHWRSGQHLIAPNIDLIRRLRPPYRMSVLSNAASTLRARLRDDHGIIDLFDDVVCSAEVGMAKPNPAIYALAAERLGLAPAECVFVDDLERNVEAAREAGMHGIHFRVDLGHDLEQQFAELGVPAGDGA